VVARLVPDLDPLDLLDLEPPALVAMNSSFALPRFGWGKLTISFLRPAGQIGGSNISAGEPGFDQGVVAEAQAKPLAG
jgi:hypothetical protein